LHLAQLFDNCNNAEPTFGLSKYFAFFGEIKKYSFGYR